MSKLTKNQQAALAKAKKQIDALPVQKSTESGFYNEKPISSRFQRHTSTYQYDRNLNCIVM